MPKDHIYEWGFHELKEELERNFVIESVVGTFIQIPKLRKALREDPNGWTPEQYEMLEQRYGRQFLRMTAAVFYPEVANNCAWVLRKK